MRLLLCCCLLLTVFSVRAQQLQIIQQAPPAGSLSPTDCWNLTVSNPGTEERVYLLGIVKNAAGKRLSEVRSGSLRLRTGINRLDRQNVQTQRTDYEDADIQRAILQDGYFPPGAYTICVAVMRSDDDREIGLACLDFSVIAAANAHKTGDKTKNKQLHFYGNAAIEAVYANQQGLGQELPPSYARLDFNPALSILQAPVTANIHLTTERSDQYPDLNTFSLRFDRATFRQNLQDMLLQKYSDLRLSQAKADAANLAKLTELDNLEAVLQDAALRRELLGVDSLQAQISRAELDKTLKLEEKQRKLEQLRSKYDALLAKKRQVERLVERKNQLLALKNQWQKSGYLDAVKDRLAGGNLPALSDPATLRQQMKQYGLMAGANRFLFGIEELSIGTSYPVYSPLTLNGVQVNGAHLAWNPGPFYVAVTGGKTRSAYFSDLQPLESDYTQRLIGAKIGLGKIYGSHLTFTGLRFRDQRNSISVPDSLAFYPTQTTLAATDFQITVGKKRIFELAGEVSGLLFNRNLLDSSVVLVDSSLTRSLPGWLQPNLSTGADFAWNGRANLNLFDHQTRLIVSSRFVGPGFINPGTPGLRNDVLAYDARFEQNIAHGRMRVAAGYRTEADNFSGAKGVRTLRDQLNGELLLRFKKAPQLRLQYLHNLQENSSIRYAADVWSVWLQQSWRTHGQTRANTSLNYLRFTNAVDSFSNAQFDAHYFLLNQMFVLAKGFSATFNGQLTLLNNAGTQQQQQQAGLLLSGRFLKNLSLSAGVSWANSAQIDQKLGGQLQLNWPVSKYLLFEIMANYNQFSNLPGTNTAFQEQFVRGRVLLRW